MIAWNHRSPSLEYADPGIVLDIGPVPARVAEAERVRMRGCADLEHEDELMLRTIERAHPAIGLIPDAQVLELGEHRLTGPQKLAHVAPVHAHEGDRAIAGEGCGMPERLAQERREDLG